VKLAIPLAPFSILFQPYLEKIDESQSVVHGLAEMADYAENQRYAALCWQLNSCCFGALF
jgi:hypothetical protein